MAKVLLLLNAGRGNEFKGKSLDEIEIENEASEIFDDNKSEEDTENSKPNERQICNDDYLQPERTNLQKNPNSKKQNRHRWSEVDKKLVLNFFKKHIEEKRAPKKEDCLKFIGMNKSFSGSDWVRIKTFVYNTYRLK